MKEDHCWYNLNIDISNALRSDISFTRSDLRVWSFKDPREVFSDSWIDYMTRLGFPIFEIMVFYRPANCVDTEAHVDGFTGSYKSYAINWVVGGDDSEMIWYNLPEQEPPQTFTMAKTPYLSWPIKQLTEIDRCTISNTPTLVKVNLPHSIIVKDQPRICISFRAKSFRNNWNFVTKYLKVKNLLIPRE